MKPVFVATLSCWACLAPAYAQTPGIGEGRAQSFTVRKDAVLETGDTFVQDGVRYRLWGVQACLPDTRVDLGAGQLEDCGAVSLAGLAGFLRDGAVVCTEIARSRWQGEPYAFASCTLRLRSQEVELGTALIGSGLAFAALGPNGQPIHPFYAAAEAVAREDGEGLWTAFAFDHPSERLAAETQKR